MTKGVYTRTKKIRKNISESKKGDKNPMFGKVSPMKGKKRTKKFKQLISIALKGRSLSELHRKNCNCSFCKASRGELSGKNHPMYGQRGEKHPKWSGGYNICRERGTLKRVTKIEELAGRSKTEHCEICGNVGRICFDHDHSISKKYTKEAFRGWICVQCNCILGLAKDDPKLLRKLADYLDNTKYDKK